MTSASLSASSPSSPSRSAPPSASAPSPTGFASSATSSPVSLISDHRLRAALRGCEEAWELAFARCGELALALVAARSARDFSRVAGHQILATVGKAQALAGEGGSELATAHRLLEQFARVNGIELASGGDDDFGDGRKPPSIGADA